MRPISDHCRGPTRLPLGLELSIEADQCANLEPGLSAAIQLLDDADTSRLSGVVVAVSRLGSSTYRITIQRDLDAVRRQRKTQRAGRQRAQWPLASIVGYTNAGKSTLLNQLTGADVVAKDILFATLDPTTRRMRLPSNQNILLTDTVGFIRKLPHGLVEAFKATLEEVVQADLLLHVVDTSHPQADEQIAAVNTVLNEIGAGDKPTLMVFNKVDRLNGGNSEFNGAVTLTRLRELYPNSVAISATMGTGIEELLAEIGSQIRPERELLELKIPHEQSAVQ